MSDLNDELERLQRENETLRLAFNDRVRVIEMQLKDKEELQDALASLKQQLAEAKKDAERMRFGLENCRLLAARHRKEDWALLILGFCAEAGVVGSVTR